MDKKMRKGKKRNSFLARLAKANEESFGDQKLNCCDLKGFQKSKEIVNNSGGNYAKK